MTAQTIATATAGTDATATEKSPAMRRLETVLHYSVGIVGVLSAVVAIAKFLDTGVPGCASSRTDRTLASIARANQLDGARITARREVSRDASEARCAAVLTTADGTRHDLTYRIFRNEAGRVRVSAAWQAI